MNNPLVAERRDSTTGYTGIGIAESAADLYNGVSSGSWVEGGLGFAGTGLEMLSLALDPLGTLLQYAVSWIIEHVGPLRDALNWLAGDADQIAAYATTWQNVSQSVGRAHEVLTSEVGRGTAGWTGAAADAYRRSVAEQAEHITAAAGCSATVGTVVQVVGVLVGTVRGIVRDLVAECVATLVARIPQWLAEEAVTLGFATPHVVASAVAIIAKWVNRISDVITKLVRSVGRLRPLMNRLGEIWEAIKKGLRALKRADAPGAPRTPDPVTLPGSPDVKPRGGTTPSGTTAPSSTSGPTVSAPPPTHTPPATTTPAGTTTPSGAPVSAPPVTHAPPGGTTPSGTTSPSSAPVTPPPVAHGPSGGTTTPSSTTAPPATPVPGGGGGGSGPKIIRRDDHFPNTVNSGGIRKSHLDADGNLVPANPHGKTEPWQHVLGGKDKAAKADSPYTSFSVEGADAKLYGNKEVRLDHERLQADIDAGKVTDVEILPPAKVEASLQGEVDRLAGRAVDVTLPHDATPDQVRKFAEDLGLSKGKTESIISRLQGLLNTRRDGEWLIKGTVPAEYIQGPYDV
ncbi:hypothetical protein ACFFSW_08215 [Saccharothrix longispora]|uniref:Uncharacterized protein YukE n=1 Tax=Saccharothrix longispora TaxID=33920 RepID=A0ABU1Q6U8_9PSEU|nr:hypothetical protein [Saccharothrix longispora]MDR6598625.1 uncharacterized protein YukE [Saccharothrix longispora]